MSQMLYSSFYLFVIMPPWPCRGGIEHLGCLYVFPSVDQDFVQGSISSSINGSKLIFHMRMYLYETCGNTQES